MRPLRILMVVHHPWSRNLGAPRAQMEIAEELRLLGHEVDKFDLFDAFPDGPPTSRLRVGPTFASRVARFLRERAGDYDVVDANQGDVPFEKDAVGLRGLLVVRSAGLYAFYHRYAAEEEALWPHLLPGTAVGRSLLRRRRRRQFAHERRSLEVADLINVLNGDEARYVSDTLGFGGRCVEIPLGLSEQTVSGLGGVRPEGTAALVVSVGSWSLRKGRADWGAIVRRTRELVPTARFRFVGTGVGADGVLQDLDARDRGAIDVVPSFDPEELPSLLEGASVGALPTYIEGFGLGILEQLAAGLPSIAYDVPGPRVMVPPVDSTMLVPRGNVDAFAARLATVLRLDRESYGRLSERSRQVALGFRMRDVASRTAAVYTEALSHVA